MDLLKSIFTQFPELLLPSIGGILFWVVILILVVLLVIGYTFIISFSEYRLPMKAFLVISLLASFLVSGWFSYPVGGVGSAILGAFLGAFVAFPIVFGAVTAVLLLIGLFLATVDVIWPFLALAVFAMLIYVLWGVRI